MIKLELELGDGHRVKIGDYKTIKAAFRGITNYLNKIKFVSYYQRISIIPADEENDREIWVDFGSHTQFFYINGFNDDEYKEWIGRSNVK